MLVCKNGALEPSANVNWKVRGRSRNWARRRTAPWVPAAPRAAHAAHVGVCRHGPAAPSGACTVGRHTRGSRHMSPGAFLGRRVERREGRAGPWASQVLSPRAGRGRAPARSEPTCFHKAPTGGARRADAPGPRPPRRGSRAHLSPARQCPGVADGCAGAAPLGRRQRVAHLRGRSVSVLCEGVSAGEGLTGGLARPWGNREGPREVWARSWGLGRPLPSPLCKAAVPSPPRLEGHQRVERERVCPLCRHHLQPSSRGR